MSYSRTSIRWMSVAWCLCTAAAAADNPPDALQDTELQGIARPFFQKHCFRCHGPDQSKGDLRLDRLDADLSWPTTLERWRKIAERVLSAEMPPEKEPRPEPRQVADFVKGLTTRLDEAAANPRADDRVVLRRLNRVEYENTVHDLFDVRVSVKEMLPEDAVSHGFDNVGAALNISPVLIERYLDAADAVITAAIAPVHTLESKTERFNLYDSLPEWFVAGVWMQDEGVILFRTSGDSATDLRQGQSITDALLGEAQDFQRGLGKLDRQKLDDYFTSVREVEQRMVKAQDWTRRPKPKVDIKTPVDVSNYVEIVARVRLMIDLMHLALQTDSTRFITFALNGFNAVPAIPGVTQDWHNLSHHGQDPAKLLELRVVELQLMQLFGELLTKLKSTPEGGGTLLDRTIVLFGSNLGNASSHDNKNLPILVAGGGFRHGQHLAFDPAKNVPLCNLYVQFLRRLGADVNAFGSSTGTISGFEQAG